MFVLQLLSFQEEKLAEAGRFAPSWAPPLFEPEDDFELVLIQWSTEYDRVMRTHPSKRAGKDKLAEHYIAEEQHRLMSIAMWRQETNRGIKFWTDEKKAAVQYDPKIAMLWGKWLAWVPPPPRRGSEPDPPPMEKPKSEPPKPDLPKPKAKPRPKESGKGGKKHGRGKGKGKGKK